MKLGHRIPVEPLDDDRLVNIERAVVAGAADRVASPFRESRPLLVLLAGACAAAAAGIVGWQLRGAPDEPARPTPSDPPALAVRTDAERATIDIGDATIASDPATAFSVTRPSGSVIVAMERGRVELSVGKRGARPPLVVRAGDTDVEVVGTKFSVDYDGHAAVDVRVSEGTVKVTRQHEATLVAAGREWKTGEGLVAVAPPPVIAQAEVPPARVIVTTAPPSAAVTVDAKQAALRDHRTATPIAKATATAPRAAVATVRPPVRAPAIEPGAHRVAIVASDPYVELKVAIRSQAIAFDPKLDGTGDAAAEIGRLKKIAYSPTTLGGDASAALYRIAVLLHKPLKQDSEALRTLDIYRRRFARGRELEAAQWLRVRILCGHQIDDGCRQAAYGYQQQAPTGAAGDVAVRITNSQ